MVKEYQGNVSLLYETCKKLFITKILLIHKQSLQTGDGKNFTTHVYIHTPMYSTTLKQR